MYGATSGYRTEGDAGLSQVGARYYDAQVGRFITRDTYLDQAPYLYCDHDPVNATDPSGHFGNKWEIIGMFVVVFGAATVDPIVITGGFIIVGIGAVIEYREHAHLLKHIAKQVNTQMDNGVGEDWGNKNHTVGPP